LKGISAIGPLIFLLAACGAAGAGTATETPIAATQASTATPTADLATPIPAPSPSPSPTVNPVVLNPATTPSVAGTCSEQLSFGADGNAGPIVCTNGAVNVLAWNYFTTSSAGLFAAGSNATPAQIQQLESSAQGWTGPIGQSVYCLAAAYYAWSFGLNLDPLAQGGGTASCAANVPNWP
jgi:hypothetical protein